MKKTKTFTLALLTVALAAAGCGTTVGSDSDSDSGTGGQGTDTDSGTGGSGTDTDSGTGGGGSDTDGLGGGAGADGSGDGSGATSSAGGSQSGTGGTLPTGIEFEYDPSLDLEPETCADVQIDSEEIFLDIFMILDRSGSMTQPFGDNDSNGYCDVIDDPNNGSRWCNAINAIYGFFSDASTVGTGLSYGEFSNTGCDPFGMAVDFGVIEDGTSTQLDSLVGALNDDDPDGGTATQGAVETLIEETSTHTPTGTRRTIGVLITDGNPTQCLGQGGTAETESTQLNGFLVDHYEATGIPTFIIGMTGATMSNLELMAVGAGAEPHADYCDPSHTSCSYYTVGDGNPDAFMAALDSIRSSVLGCEYVVPASQVGLADLDTLDVHFTPATGETAIGLTRVADEAACAGPSEFYVDISGADPIVKLCPATCDLRDEGASIDIQLLCEGS